MFKRVIALILIISWTCTDAKLPEIDSTKTILKINEIMKAHASHKELKPEIMKRTLNNYLEELDPLKTYFIQSDIEPWLQPSESSLNRILESYQMGDFAVFFEIHKKMEQAIERRRNIEEHIDSTELPTDVKSEEFKDMEWATNQEELKTRLERLKSLQIETSSKLNEELKEKSLQRLHKHQERREGEILNQDPVHRSHFVLSNILKATASALDAHTTYFTPDEASQFLINVQQRLFGIGAQLRDDLNGFTVVKIIEGGPAATGNLLKLNDRIVAVDGEPVVGMEITKAVELIRGDKGTPVTLTVIRKADNDNGEEQQLDIIIMRDEVVLKETRFESSYEPFGDGIIGYLKLYSFYQDPESSSAKDLANEIERLKKEHKIKGIILDLRYNSGGMLSQAVGVTSLFISKGIIVGIKDNTGSIQYLRDTDENLAWDGPLVILVNRGSASASEIVAQTLQDYGRAIIIGDDHTFGKGSFQTFTLNTQQGGTVNLEGEYKVTRGRYYTVSGKTPQLTGVTSDIEVPGPLSQIDIGEKFAKYPLESDFIKENFDDDLSDIPYIHRSKFRSLYKFNLQPKLTTYTSHLETLRRNSEYRIENNKNYQAFLKEIKKKNATEGEAEEQFGQNDLQLSEAYNIIKDLILLLQDG